MAKHPPVKNTSGEGFVVEDYVVGQLACHLLVGVPWSGVGEGLIRTIECQMRQDGWLFDDAVLSIEVGGKEYRCGCSIKSHTVFTKAGAPRDFARALWDQWRGGNATNFQRDGGLLSLIAPQHEPEVREAWVGLTDAARVMAPETMALRHENGTEPSPLRRAAFKSLQAADDSTQAADGSVEAVRLLRRFRLAQHDFQHTDSQSAAHAIGLCQQALQDAARSRAGELWEAIVTFAGSIRRKGGRITLPGLLAKLAHRFPLKQHPDYAADWTTILTESRERVASLPTRIGGLVAVERGDLIERINQGMGKHHRVAVLGASGNGKSVLSCEWALRGKGQAVWLRAADLSAPGGLRASFRLSRGVAELFANASCQTRLVLDGLDKCFDDAAFDEAALLLRATCTPEAGDRWEVVLTCCPEDWERVRGQFIRRGVALPDEIVRVERFDEEQARKICARIPSLRLLGQRPHLFPVLRWPKALDIVATYWQAAEAPLQWATESNFARWFWRSTISREDPASFRDLVARKLAVQLADRMTSSASLDGFSREEAETLAQLGREGHLEIDGVRRTVRFSHELTADWARQRELQVQGSSAATFLQSRLHSSFWHRAVRFHALDLLEFQPDVTAWREFFAAFGGNSATDEMAQNLLLEAPIFASNQRTVLDRLWPVLQLDGGKLLRRFLRQFLRVATIPDEEVVARFASRGADLQLEASVLHRLPWAPYWFEVLEFLAANAEQAAGLARGEVADICLLWLRLYKHIGIGMEDAATLAVVSARQVYRDESKWHGRPDKTSSAEKACQALLAAAPAIPDEVSRLALKFCGRLPPDPADGSPGTERHHRSQFTPDPGPPMPWPEGPQRPCARIFRNAFMNSDYSGLLFRALPEVGAEIMFAVLLNLPRANWHPREYGHDIDEHGFASEALRHESCFWISGPFLTFLRTNPAVALPAIIRLVNFATDRAYEIGEDVRHHLAVPITVGGEKHEWRGHQFSHVWHQGHVFAPRAVGCALLSLEKWFYLLMDADEPLDSHLDTIFRDSHSIALAGVLICVGKRRPELFLGPLRPLVEAIDFYWIEDALSLRGEGGFNASAFYERSPVIVEAWREWVQMPHRKESIHHLVIRMFLGQASWREMVAGFRPAWQARLDAATEEEPAPPWLARIVSEFDPVNWHTERQENRTLILYDPPASLPQPTPDELAQLRRSELLMQIPWRCRQILVEGAECSEEQMAELWSQLAAVREVLVPEEERGVRNNEDALCGIVAVAVVKHRAWLAADLKRESEAIAILAEVGAQQSAPFWLTEDDSIDFKWDSFAAWALATLWCERPDEPFLRQAVGALALWDRHLVISRVMSVAAAHRVQLGLHFGQLLAHTVRYAPARHRARMEDHAPERTFDLAAWVATHLEKFMASQTEPLPADWTTLIESPQGRRGRHPTSGLDIGHLCAALAWAEDLDAARDAEEQETWLHYHRQGFLCALTRIRHLAASPVPSEPWDDHQQHWPYGDERRLIERVGRIVARLRPGENHRSLWQPLFAVGLVAARWMGSFLGRWMIEAAGHEEVAPAFIEQWRAILTYAEQSRGTSAWESKSGFLPGGSRDVWEDLLGFSRTSPDFWDERLAPAVEAVREFHERWAERSVTHWHDARTYIYFLEARAARKLCLDGLLRLRRRVPIDDPYFWSEPEIRNAFAGFLRRLLDGHWEELRESPAGRDAFMAFALKLAALQHPLGCEVLALAGNRFGATA